jgi:uncharacterized membrane protein YfcA
MPLSEFSAVEWAWVTVAAIFCGMGKAGLAGLGLLNVLIMAWLIPGPASSGTVLPMLIAADIVAVSVFGKSHTDWRVIGRLLVPMVAGIVAGWWLMPMIPARSFAAVIGWMVLAMAVLQITRQSFPGFDRRLPQSRTFGASIGFLSGVATMIANAAGPIGTIYFLILGFAKREFIATMAWLFLIVNVLKIPFSAQQGLITPSSLALNAVLLPAVVAGFFIGRAAVERLAQRAFERIVFALTVVSALRLVLA